MLKGNDTLRDKRLLIIAGLIVLIPLIAIAWWLGSPFFTSKTVDEELPFSANAVVPAGIVREDLSVSREEAGADDVRIGPESGKNFLP